MQERLQQKNKEALAILTIRNKERAEQMKRENSERDEHLRRENKQLEKEQRRRNKEKLALLLSENEAEMATMMAKQEQKKGVTMKRKADQLDTNRQPAAPECPVCAWKLTFCESKSEQSNYTLVQVCFEKMVPPTKIFQCGNGGRLVCETCKYLS